MVVMLPLVRGQCHSEESTDLVTISMLLVEEALATTSAVALSLTVVDGIILIV